MRQSGLGRGLGALIPEAATMPERQRGAVGSELESALLLELPIAAVRPNSYQPRTHFDDGSLDSLTDSVRELGVLQPILVREVDGGYELIAGERRWRAARRAGLATVPAIVRTVEDMGALEQAVVENLHREDLNALEEAAAFKQLIDDFSLTHEQVSQRVGKSRAAVSNTLRLLQLSAQIQRMIVDGQLSAGCARALLGTSDKSFQESLARRAVAEGMSVRSVEEAVRLRSQLGSTNPARETPGPPSLPSAADRPAGLIELEELLSAQLDTRVRVDLTPKKGRIVIEVADLNDLERVYRRIAGAAEVPERDDG